MVPCGGVKARKEAVLEAEMLWRWDSQGRSSGNKEGRRPWKIASPWGRHLLCITVRREEGSGRVHGGEAASLAEEEYDGDGCTPREGGGGYSGVLICLLQNEEGKVVKEIGRNLGLRFNG